jgi:polysaccharide export outer membrane protein
MFQEFSGKTTPVKQLPSAPSLKVKPMDNLYVRITTVDPEVNKIFNPSNVGEGYSSGTSTNFGDPTSQYINGFRVSADSIISLPILGDINLVGLNLEESQQKVKRRAEEYLKDPSVQVKFLNYRINVSGEVRTPGIYYNYEGSINMLDAIGLAGGITEFADLNHVILKRNNGNTVATYEVNLTDNSIYNSEVFYLIPNDLVYIPPSDLKRRNANSDTYARLLGTLSTILVALALFMK